MVYGANAEDKDKNSMYGGDGDKDKPYSQEHAARDGAPADDNKTKGQLHEEYARLKQELENKYPGAAQNLDQVDLSHGEAAIVHARDQAQGLINEQEGKKLQGALMGGALAAGAGAALLGGAGGDGKEALVAGAGAKAVLGGKDEEAKHEPVLGDPLVDPVTALLRGGSANEISASHALAGNDPMSSFLINRASSRSGNVAVAMQNPGYDRMLQDGSIDDPNQKRSLAFADPQNADMESLGALKPPAVPNLVAGVDKGKADAGMSRST